MSTMLPRPPQPQQIGFFSIAGISIPTPNLNFFGFGIVVGSRLISSTLKDLYPQHAHKHMLEFDGLWMQSSIL